MKQKKLSLYPLKFDEVVADVLKVKPKKKRSSRVKATPKKRRH
jgi:hypothetical protein